MKLVNRFKSFGGIEPKFKASVHHV